MKCVCGATLPLTSRFSICDGCMQDPDDPAYEDDYNEEDESEY
jgi:hypothetical protein